VESMKRDRVHRYRILTPEDFISISYAPTYNPPIPTVENQEQGPTPIKSNILGLVKQLRRVPTLPVPISCRELSSKDSASTRGREIILEHSIIELIEDI